MPAIKIDHNCVFDDCSPKCGFPWLTPAIPPQSTFRQTKFIAGNVRQPLQAPGAGISTPPTEEIDVPKAKAVVEYPCTGKAKTRDITNNVGKMR